MIRIKSPADAILAWLLLGVAIVLWLGSADLPLGRAARMGPAYVPRLVSVLLVAVGVALLVRSLIVEGHSVSTWPIRAILAILSGLLAFCFLVEYAGLFAAIPALVILVSLGDRELRPFAIGTVAVALTAFASILFVQLLGLPLPLWKFGG